MTNINIAEMSKEIDGKEAAWIFIFVFILFACFISYRRNKKIERIEKNPVWVVAEISEIDDFGNKYSGPTVYYNYVVNDSLYQDSDMYRNLKRGKGEVFQGKKFFVIYEKDDPCNHKILISREDYDIFSLRLPDSLKWTDAYFK